MKFRSINSRSSIIMAHKQFELEATYGTYIYIVYTYRIQFVWGREWYGWMRVDVGVNVGASLMCCSYAKYSTVDVYSIRSRVPSTSLSWSFIIHMHTQTSLLSSSLLLCSVLCCASQGSKAFLFSRSAKRGISTLLLIWSWKSCWKATCPSPGLMGIIARWVSWRL